MAVRRHCFETQNELKYHGAISFWLRGVKLRLFSPSEFIAIRFFAAVQTAPVRTGETGF